MVAITARSRSTKVAFEAPLDRASMPNAPLPANRSRTTASSTASRLASMENMASRTRSLVGRVVRPSGARNVPPTGGPGHHSHPAHATAMAASGVISS